MAVRTGDGTGPRSVLAPGTGSDQDVWLHYGFTSTGMWISSQCGHSAVLLTNKIQYARDRSDAARCCQSSPAGKPPGEEDTSSRAIAEGGGLLRVRGRPSSGAWSSLPSTPPSTVSCSLSRALRRFPDG
ncbi:hypothetical protein Save01_08202 [Streptomyces avermitilis]|uniref:Uncharacterized protein n=1 Tax=Streptomyces avermitilis TaxID=33903 RepID=A0A4D4N6A5_STRAX|nr:hypothetical protein SAV31267_094280 [Streptomyces avermitilis]